MKCAIILLFCACGILGGPVEQNSLATSNRKFAASVYKEILKTNKGNLIFSPFSAETVLALLSAGAVGESYDELVSGLSLPNSQEAIQKSFKEFLPTLKSDTDDLKLLSANKIYAGKNVKLEPAYQKVAVDIYNSAVDNIDFKENVKAAADINKWVEEQTNEKIKDLISKDDLSEDTALVLINALYLSAKWQHSFSEYQTRPEKFYKTATQHVEVPMMSQISSFNYYDNTELGAQFLELPYKTEGLSMVIVLPHEKEGLTALEPKIEKVLEPQPFTHERVDVKLPKFTIESEIKFVEILKSLGVKKIFDEQSADLTGLSSNRKNLYVSNVLQKAFINVTESGTEAAAATAVTVNLSRVMIVNRVPPKIFHADHPFQYYIIKDGVILFGGRVNSV